MLVARTREKKEEGVSYSRRGNVESGGRSNAKRRGVRRQGFKLVGAAQAEWNMLSRATLQAVLNSARLYV